MELQAQGTYVMKHNRGNAPLGLPPSETFLIRKSFRILASRAKQLGARLYDLFEYLKMEEPKTLPDGCTKA